MSSSSSIQGLVHAGPDSRTGAAAPERTRRAGPVVAALEGTREVIDRILAVTCVVIFAVLVVVVTWQVLSRQVLQSPATWTEETARYVFVVLALLGGALVFSERGHIAVEILVARLPATAQKAISFLVEATVVFFALYVLVYGGYRVAMNAWGQNISTMPVSVGQVYLVLPLAGVLVAFFSICHVVGVVTGNQDPVPVADENNQGI